MLCLWNKLINDEASFFYLRIHVYIMTFKWKVILLNNQVIKMFAKSVNQHLYNVIHKSPISNSIIHIFGYGLSKQLIYIYIS